MPRCLWVQTRALVCVWMGGGTPWLRSSTNLDPRYHCNVMRKSCNEQLRHVLHCMSNLNGFLLHFSCGWRPWCSFGRNKRSKKRSWKHQLALACTVLSDICWWVWHHTTIHFSMIKISFGLIVVQTKEKNDTQVTQCRTCIACSSGKCVRRNSPHVERRMT